MSPVATRSYGKPTAKELWALLGSHAASWSGTMEATYAQLGAKGSVSTLKLSNEDGRERVIQP